MVRLVALIGALALSPAAQTKDAVNVWIQKSFEAVTVYRQGDTQRALDILATMTVDEQENAVAAIRAQLARIAAGWPPRKEDVVQWTPRLLRALGALQMEAAIALNASDERDERRAADRHIELAKAVFAVIFLVVKEEEDSAPRWLLVLGLDEMRKGEFSRAFSILGPACEEYAKYAPLLLACGTTYENYSFQPGEALPTRDDVMSQFRVGDVMFRALSPTLRGLSRARAVHNRYLSIARNFLERALALDNASNETLLRLAHVRLRQGDDREATRLLETLIARPSLDARESYLSRLFLARIHERHDRLDEATAALKAAPAGQSVLLARARHALARGNAGEAAALAESAASAQDDDFWWGYRFGQYWVPSALLKQLREEARK